LNIGRPVPLTDSIEAMREPEHYRNRPLHGCASHCADALRTDIAMP
jgi:hypothetical protein